MGELDVWLHQKVGQEILQGNGFPQFNTFSFTEPNHPWTNHEWLFQIIIAATGPGIDDPSSGIERWVILRSIISLLLIGLLLIGDKPWQRNPRLLIWLAPGLLLGVTLLWTRLLLRPELLSYGLLVLIIRQAEGSGLSNNRSPSWWETYCREIQVFLITIVWAQLHGFSALAPILWLMAGLISYVPGQTGSRPGLKRLLGSTTLLLVTLLLTPNGWNGLIYPITALSQFSTSEANVQSSISELQPLLQSDNGLYLTIMAFKVSLVWGLALVILSWKRLSLVRIIFWVLAAVAAIMAQRNIGFYAVAFVLLHTGVSDLKTIRIPGIPGLSTSKSPLFIIPALLTVGCAVWLWSSVISDAFYLTEGQSRRFGTGATVSRYPFKAIDLLARSEGGKVFANIDAASLTLSRGRSKVFIDGRTEAYSPSTWLQYQNLRMGHPQSLDVIQQSGAKNVLLTLGSGAFRPLLNRLLESPDWQLSYAEPAGVLFSKRANSIVIDNKQALVPYARMKPDPTEKHFSTTRRADQWASRATLAGLAGLPTDQEEYLRNGLNLCPQHPLLNHNLGNLLMQKNQPAKALAHFTVALKTNPRLGGTFLNAGVCQMNLRDFNEAEHLFAKATKLQPENFQAWANHSLALQQLRRQSEALQSLTEAVRLAPHNTQLRQALQNLRSSR